MNMELIEAKINNIKTSIQNEQNLKNIKKYDNQKEEKSI